MKGVMAWIKSHVPVVVCLALIVLSLPAAWFFSSRWSKGIVQREQKKADSQLGEVNRVKSHTYVLPPVMPGEQPVEVRYAPNVTMARHFENLHKTRQAQVDRVTDEALAFNMKEPASKYRDYIETLKTNPRSPMLRTLPIDVVRQFGGDRPGTGLYGELLNDKKSGVERLGMPLPPPRVQQALERRSQEFRAELIRARGPAEGLSAEEQTRLAEELKNLRLDLYRRRAADVSVFGDPMMLRAAGTLTAVANVEIPDEEQLFEVQWTYWVTSEILKAIDLANTNGDRRVGADTGVVKRIVSYNFVDRLSNLYGAAQEYGMEQVDAPQARPAVPESEDGLVGTAAGWSLTGRLTNPSNQLYDVREVRISLIVDAERLSEFMLALPRTNFMTVTGLNLYEVDVWGDLRQGYYYGQAPVVRADMVIETIWLRDWMAQWMPPRVKTGLGIQETEAPPGEG